MRLPNPMKSARSFLTAALGLGALLAGCDFLQQESGDPPIVLHLTLDDSLTRYDRAIIDVASLSDTATVLETIWAKELPSPPVLPAHTLTKVKGPFVVKVRCYRGAGQLALETFIFYEGGRKRVVRNRVPPLVPANMLRKLNAQPGVLDPPFNPEILTYTLTLPPNVDSVAFDVSAAYPKATIMVNGQQIKSDTPFTVPAAHHLMPILVSDLGAMRAYMVTLIPANAKPLKLDSAAWSAGSLEPAFDPDKELFTLTLPASQESVDLQFWPTDPSTTNLLVMNKATSAGTRTPVTLAAPGASTVVTVRVARGEEFKEYNFIVKRAQ